MSGSNDHVEVNGRLYRVPRKPTVVVCVDGFDPEYLDAGVADGILPNLAAFSKAGFHATAHCAIPSLTNPNNVSIITGAPTAIHGIAGNCYLDRETGEERMILDASLLRGTTILAQMAQKGVRVAAISAKDKLRRIINHGLSHSQSGAICFSAQCADKTTLEENGIANVEEWLGQPSPPQYSGELSLYVLDAGIKLLQERRADLLYLTLSDFVQHHYAPQSADSNDFMQKLDDRIGQLVQTGAVVSVTGDHGMSDKANDDGSPNVLFLQDELSAKWPDRQVRVICPISDPFVKHHGALGSFVRVHLNPASSGQNGSSASHVDEMLAFCQSLPQVEAAYRGEEAAALFAMPADREADIVVVANKNAVIGGRRDEHDLAAVEGHRLRSHGGLGEQRIPLMRSKPLASHRLIGDDKAAPRQWRNFDVFDVALNW
ncbi:alkaline-phosphatase-like protein [Trichoderma ceciliae]